MGEQFGTEMYDKKYTDKEVGSPRSVVVSFAEKYLAQGSHCLDLGCGAGRHSRYLADRGMRVTAVDRSVVGVDKTRALLKNSPGSNALVADVHRLPFLDKSFESVVSNRVLDYNDDAGLDQAFAEIGRVTTDGAVVLITVRAILQPSKADEELIGENEYGGKTFRVNDGSEAGAFQHYFTQPEIEMLAQRYHFQVMEIREQQKTNDKGEYKAEWQVVLKKVNQET